MVESQGAGIQAGDTVAPQANGIGAKTVSRQSPGKAMPGRQVLPGTLLTGAGRAALGLRTALNGR